MDQLVGGQVKVTKKTQKHPHFDVPSANTKPKTKNFFSRCQLEDLLNP